MSAPIAVSAYSLRELIGPLVATYPDADGASQTLRVEYPTELTVQGFIAEARARLGVDQIELCQIQIASAGSADIFAIREALDAQEVGMLNVPLDIGDLGSPRRDVVDASIAEHQRWFAFARDLGSQHVRVNAGSPLNGLKPSVPSLIAALDRLADSAAELGLRLLIENHGGESSNPQFLLDLIDAVGADRLGVLLDLGNFQPILDLADTPASERTAELAQGARDAVLPHITALAPHASLLHAKTYDSGAGAEISILPLAPTLDAALAAGYRGPISLEYEGEGSDPWAATSHALEVVRQRVSQLDT
jgi:sugar phosphate isomerase/epimerase